MLAEMTGWKHLNISQLVKDKSLHSGRNKEWDSFILDEDKVCDELEEIMIKGANIVDFHTCDFFPERWFHLVVVLRTSNEVLYPRLEKRGYSLKKLQENVEAEIMQVVRDEAIQSYKKEIVVTLQSDNVNQMESNVNRICEWIAKAEEKKRK
eukprot:359729-Amorphochlora_amoeboformis.AAC.3